MIQSVNNKTIKDLVKLKNKKTRDEKGLFSSRWIPHGRRSKKSRAV